ncbi:hypothetical protein NDU88_003011 [Pleurodeles waltl]|uniref:Uncharacterized protein n=1 Tax=Pleurodeles waltl TaxID=8319 RepID=A0AAV7RHB8_PLEWA|nr:hypothetical protein NDU88_003011 [Pleurodeles waltl]
MISSDDPGVIRGRPSTVSCEEQEISSGPSPVLIRIRTAQGGPALLAGAPLRHPAAHLVLCFGVGSDAGRFLRVLLSSLRDGARLLLHPSLVFTVRYRVSAGRHFVSPLRFGFGTADLSGGS